MKIKRFIMAHAVSRYLFTNHKTSGASADFGVCRFMHKKPNQQYTSTICPGCYSATLLNVYGGVRKKLEKLVEHRASLVTPEQKAADVELFRQDCEGLARLGLKKLRFYAFGDFAWPDMPYIEAASRHITVDIISKSLVLKMNEPFLAKLNNMRNVWISLSFNDQFNKEFERIEAFCVDQKSSNIQLNYTVNYRDTIAMQNPRLKRVQVLHVMNRNKQIGIQEFKIPETKICGAFNPDGTRTTKKGTCHECKNCHLSYRGHQSRHRAKLPDILQSPKEEKIAA